MTSFSELSRTPTPPVPPDGSLAGRQRKLDELFPWVVSGGPFRRWSPGDPIPASGNRLLVGVATWSAYDMKLLDTVSGALQRPKAGLTVEVFNVADCPTPESFERYVPG